MNTPRYNVGLIIIYVNLKTNKMETIKLSKEFINRCNEYGIEDIKSFVKMLVRHFVPVQKLSDAMKGSNEQCSFNLSQNELTVNDPFSLFESCDIYKTFEIEYHD